MLWFHHVPWNYILKNKRTVWSELCYRYYNGSEQVNWIIKEWLRQRGKIDDQRFEQVRMLLHIQAEEAIWWRDACLLYFQTFSKMPLPPGYEQPNKTLDYYKKLRFPFAPGGG